MSRRFAIVAVLVAAIVAVVLLVSGSGSGDRYLVRAVFDTGGFMVAGEEVRIAGANVGEIEAVEVSMPDEITAYRKGEPVAVPGKAIIVMDIFDEGFQDFRRDASCLIRPQSLIGEKFVDCRPTEPRAPGSPPAPALEEIPDGQPGAGQHLLPLGRNSATVDPDLINNIQRLPYAQRFRLIFNELGAGLAGRGNDIEAAVRRANPVLRDVDRLFGILTRQRDQLAQLNVDSDEILKPLAAARADFAGFITNSGAAAEASSERGAEVEESFRKFPRFLREFRKTMASLKGFSDAAAPVFSDFGRAAPALTEATRTLGPFLDASTVSLKSLGATGEAAGPTLLEADPVIRKGRGLAKSGVSPTSELANLFVDLEESRGWAGLVELIYNTNATVNGFDQYGHFGRSLVTLTNCLDYQANTSGQSGCVARFSGTNAAERPQLSAADLYRLMETELAEKAGGTAAENGPALGVGQAGRAAGQGGGASSSSNGGTEPLLDYLLGP